jgi:hypothetical protein
MHTTPSVRRLLVLLFVGCVLVGASPAQARYGRTNVDTWVRYGDRVIGRHVDGPLKLWAPPGSTRRVIWSVENLGDATPTLRSVTFLGCDDAKGFDFRFLTPAGTDVSWAVTHDGYRMAGIGPHERGWLTIRITSTERGRAYACELTGDGNGNTDLVKVWAHS